MIIQSCGFALDIPDIYAADFAEEAPVREQVWTPHRGDIVLDIGCSLGTYTLPALARGAYVLAVDVLHIDPLVAMATDNGLAERLIALTGTIVAGPDGYPDWLMDAIRSDPVVYPELTEGHKHWTTIDRLVAENGLPHVNWVKVDTEGGELPIMLGALTTLEEWYPTLVIEEHSHLPHVREAGSGDALHQLLSGLGYSITRNAYHNREIWLCEVR